MIRYPQILLLVGAVAAPLAAQTPPAPPAAEAACEARGLDRDTVTKMTDVLLDMGFVGFEKIEIVDGCFRVAAKNPGGDIVVLTFDPLGALIGLGLGTGGAAPRFAPPRDGVRETD